MRIDVRDRGFKGSEGLRNYVGLRLMSVLDHLVREVEGVAVSLADVPGSDGLMEKQCRMLARLAPSGAVAVEHSCPALYQAIDETARRLALGVAEESARRREMQLVPAIREIGERRQ
jgi:hypothetical protein